MPDLTRCVYCVLPWMGVVDRWLTQDDGDGGGGGGGIQLRCNC